MLEFLGMEEEATRVLICLAILGPCIMFPIGTLVASGDKAGKLNTVVAVICAIVGIAAVVIGILPFIALFFTFQWNVLIKGVFFGILTGAAGYGIGYGTTLSGRKRKYRNNPIMKEAVAFSKKNQIVAVQCFENRLRFFLDLENDDYCNGHNDTHMVSNVRDSAAFQQSWKRPAAWEAYDRAPSYAGTITFADRGWPSIPDLDLFAKVLAEELGGCGVAAHVQNVQYDTVVSTSSSITTTHHITHMYSDRFVYKKAVRSRKFPKQKQREKKSPEVKTNSWE